MTNERIPVQIWTASDLRSLKWGSILLGLGVGVFLPRSFRRYGRWIALGTFVFALKPLMAMLREDTVVTADRPLDHHHAEVPESFETRFEEDGGRTDVEIDLYVDKEFETLDPDAKNGRDIFPA